MSADKPLLHYRRLLDREKKLLNEYDTLLGVVETHLAECGNDSLAEYRIREQELLRWIEKTARIRDHFVLAAPDEVGREADIAEAAVRALRSRLVIRIARTTALIRENMTLVAAELGRLRIPKTLTAQNAWGGRPVALDIKA
jgi:hypothetical protein